MTSILKEFQEAENAGLKWGNIAMLNEDDINDYGIMGAWRKMREGSEHLASSGYTSNILRAEGRKGVKAHYKRKGELEGRKEAARRAEWERLYPGAKEANWERRQAVRKTRRAAHIASRKAYKAAQKAAAAAAAASRSSSSGTRRRSSGSRRRTSRNRQ